MRTGQCAANHSIDKLKNVNIYRQEAMDGAVFARCHICRKSYSVSWLERSRMCCVLLLGLDGPWDELVAAVLIGSVVG